MIGFVSHKNYWEEKDEKNCIFDSRYNPGGCHDPGGKLYAKRQHEFQYRRARFGLQPGYLEMGWIRL
jgi:hypothetical protein